MVPLWLASAVSAAATEHCSYVGLPLSNTVPSTAHYLSAALPCLLDRENASSFTCSASSSLHRVPHCWRYNNRTIPPQGGASFIASRVSSRCDATGEELPTGHLECHAANDYKYTRTHTIALPIPSFPRHSSMPSSPPSTLSYHPTILLPNCYAYCYAHT